MLLMNIANVSVATVRFRANLYMFWTRIATSAVLAPIALGAVYTGFPFFHVMVALMGAAVLWEFTQIVEKMRLTPRVTAALIATVVGVGIAYKNIELSLGAITITWILLLVTDRSARRFSNSTTQAALICAALPAVALVAVFSIGGAVTVFWLLAVVWGTDIGAYVVGRLVGGARLAPVISPNKTWSGSIGGLIIAVLAAAFVNMLVGIGVSFSHLMYAAGLSVVAQIGDLAESSFKRQHGVKDSGTWIPGHGGVMDRVDGLWAVAPVTALICAASDGGVVSW